MIVTSPRLAAKARSSAGTNTGKASPPPVDWNEVMGRAEDGGSPPDSEFGSCIVCGQGRPVGDGLRVLGSAGPQPGYSLSCYVPHPNHADGEGRIRREFVWGTLD